MDRHHFLIIINTYQWLGIYNTDVTITRPAIFFSVNKSYQFMAAPHEHHWYVVKWTMHYLSGIIAYGLLLISATLRAYNDLDWVSDPGDHRSTSGSCIFFAPNVISWSSKKKLLVSRSSTK